MDIKMKLGLWATLLVEKCLFGLAHKILMMMANDLMNVEACQLDGACNTRDCMRSTG